MAYEKDRREVLFALVGALSAASCSEESSAPEEFYRGKTIQVLIGMSAGGAYDIYARMLARHMGKHIPGNPVLVPSNMEGAGSLTLTNYLYNVAPKDGTVIGTINRGAPFEPLILVIAVHWRSGHEWAAHSALARAEGVSDEVIDALRDGHRPVFAREDEQIIYDFVHELTHERHVSDTAYAEAVALIGEDRMVELVNACGYYIALAAMLNAFDVHPPKGLEDPWPRDAIGD